MSEPATTVLLLEWRNGNRDAGRELFKRMQPELRRIAAVYMSREGPGHTLQPTALVNELFLRFIGDEPVAWQDRAHFLAVASRNVRRILVDHARDRRAAKRGGEAPRAPLNDQIAAAPSFDDEVLDLHIALEKLEALEPRAAQVVELRYFGGLTEKEAAEVMGVSVATVKRDWDVGRAFLIAEMKETV